MPKSDLETIKGKFMFYHHRNYVILLGEQLYIFATDGTQIACREDIWRPHKAIFLPSETILICGAQDKYQLLSLTDGHEFWSIPMSKRDYNGREFAFDASSNTIYDYFFRRGKCYIVKIDLLSRETETYQLEEDLRSTHAIECDESGTLCVLQSHLSMVGDKLISENGVRYQYHDYTIARGSSYYWKYKWLAEGRKKARCFLGNTDTILTDDLCVYFPGTNEQYYLLENDPGFQIPVGVMFSSADLDDSGKYVVVKWRAGRTHTCVIIDFLARKGVARYSGEYTDSCFVGNEVWVSAPDGIHRLPFPLVQDIQPDKNVFW